MKQKGTITKHIGLSTETKPVAPPGSEFYEYDTGITYICYDGTNWAEKKSESLNATNLALLQSYLADVDFSTLAEADFKAQAAAALAAQTGNSNPRVVTKTSTSNLTSGNIFNIAGSVQILAILARVSTAIQNSAQTVKLSITNDSLAAVDICAATTITNFAVKSLLAVTGTFADVLSGGGATAVNVLALNPSPILVSCTTSGVIATTFGTSGSLTGAIVWELLWIPLNAAGSITAV